ncbi:MAG: hypothetical protein K2X11_02595 [Acetobacteraceae bacterium]|nr:hypothetical protein [Acetobacteraceae bacterium]
MSDAYIHGEWDEPLPDEDWTVGPENPNKWTSGDDDALIEAPPGETAEAFTVLVNGQPHQGWQSIRVTRGIERLAADFDVKYSDRIAGEAPGVIPPFARTAVRLDGILTVTGYVEGVEAKVAKDGLEFAALGRSRVGDLLDCVPMPPGQEMRGVTLAAAARALCQPFGIEVIEEYISAEVFPLVAAEPGKSVHDVLKPLADLRGVILTDDAKGNLVITRAGEQRYLDVLDLTDTLSCTITRKQNERFSLTHVLGQSAGEGAWRLVDPENREGPPPPAGRAQPNILGAIRDDEVPRYRPRVIDPKQGVTTAEALRRAEWQVARDRAKGLRATVTVKGWYHGDEPWWPNRLVTLRAERLNFEEELLVARVTWTLGKEGRRVELELGPVDGYTPEPPDPTPSRGRGNWRAVERDPGLPAGAQPLNRPGASSSTGSTPR